MHTPSPEHLAVMNQVKMDTEQWAALARRLQKRIKALEQEILSIENSKTESQLWAESAKIESEQAQQELSELEKQLHTALNAKLDAESKITEILEKLEIQTAETEKIKHIADARLTVAKNEALAKSRALAEVRSARQRLNLKEKETEQVKHLAANRLEIAKNKALANFQAETKVRDAIEKIETMAKIHTAQLAKNKNMTESLLKISQKMMRERAQLQSQAQTTQARIQAQNSLIAQVNAKEKVQKKTIRILQVSVFALLVFILCGISFFFLKQ